MKHILFLIVCFQGFSSLAQKHPVEILIKIDQQHPVSISEFRQLKGLSFNIFLNDFQKINYPVLLEFKLKNHTGRTIFQFRSDLPLYLDGGSSVEIDQFNYSLYFSDTPPEEYEMNILPEGLYLVEIIVVDLFLNKPVSIPTEAIFHVLYKDPPQIITPENNSFISNFLPQNIMISWQSTFHTFLISENPTFLLKIYEHIDPAGDVFDQILNRLPVYQKQITGSFLNLDAFEFPLISGVSYAVQVCEESQINIKYINQGCSNPVVFTFGRNCPEPSALTKLHLLSGIQFSWNSQDFISNTELRYQPLEGDSSVWYFQETFLSPLNLYAVKPGITYRYQLRHVCRESAGTYSETDTFSINHQAEMNCNSGDDNINLPFSNQQKLRPGDQFFTQKYTVLIKSLKIEEGNYFGTAIVKANNLNRLQFLANFSGVQLDDQLQMLDGRIDLLGTEEMLVIEEKFKDLDSWFENTRLFFDALDLVTLENEDLVQSIRSTLAEYDLSPKDLEKMNKVLDKLEVSINKLNDLKAEYNGENLSLASAVLKETQEEIKQHIDIIQSIIGKDGILNQLMSWLKEELNLRKQQQTDSLEKIRSYQDSLLLAIENEHRKLAENYQEIPENFEVYQWNAPQKPEILSEMQVLALQKDPELGTLVKLYQSKQQNQKHLIQQRELIEKIIEFLQEQQIKRILKDFRKEARQLLDDLDELNSVQLKNKLKSFVSGLIGLKEG